MKTKRSRSVATHQGKTASPGSTRKKRQSAKQIRKPARRTKSAARKQKKAAPPKRKKRVIAAVEKKVSTRGISETRTVRGKKGTTASLPAVTVQAPKPPSVRRRVLKVKVKAPPLVKAADRVSSRKTARRARRAQAPALKPIPESPQPPAVKRAKPPIKSVKRTVRSRRTPHRIAKTTARPPEPAPHVATGFAQAIDKPSAPPQVATQVSRETPHSDNLSKAASPVTEASRISPAAPFPFRIPAILLEGDEAPPPIERRTRRSARAGDIPAELESEPQGLPEPYGTGMLLLTARDPHCLYVHWDLSREEQRAYIRLAVDGHLCLRTYPGTSPSGNPESEIRLHPESQHWFVHVQNAGIKYVVDLGYYESDRSWVSITQSVSGETPPDSPSLDSTFEVATIPPYRTPAIPVQREPRERAQEKAHESLPLPPAVTAEMPVDLGTVADEPAALRPAFIKEQAATTARHIPEEQPYAPEREMQVASKSIRPLPARVGVEPSAPGASPTRSRVFAERVPRRSAAWSETQEKILLELVYGFLSPTPLPGSAEAAGLVLRKPLPAPGVSSAEWPAKAQPSPLELPAPVSSEAAAAQPPLKAELPRAFWMNVNAELIIYGATEPDARVTMSGRPIKLRPDGSFSYRFSLPDGKYDLHVGAVSTHGDSRGAELTFSRETELQGEVAAHPQDPALRPPVPESIA